MRTTNPFPLRIMRAAAAGQFQGHCKIYRNDGYGRKLVGEARCNLHHRLVQALPGDPADASAASVELAEMHLPHQTPVMISDAIEKDGVRWLVGGGNFHESYGTYKRAMVGRPVSATPLAWVTFRRYNHQTQNWEPLPPQLAHVTWRRSQPDNLQGVGQGQQGYIFAPETQPNLDVRQGDRFYYADRLGYVTWVSPDPTERREATFSMNLGEGV